MRYEFGGLIHGGAYFRNFTMIHHFIFVFFPYFSYHSSCTKDQFTVLILKLWVVSLCIFSEGRWAAVHRLWVVFICLSDLSSSIGNYCLEVTLLLLFGWRLKLAKAGTNSSIFPFIFLEL